MRSSISSDRARSFTFRTVGAYYSNVMQAVWPRPALRSYGEGANMAHMALPVAGSRVLSVFAPYLISYLRTSTCGAYSYNVLDAYLSVFTNTLKYA